MAIELNPISNPEQVGGFNTNFQLIEDYINENLLNRNGQEVGEVNHMEVDLDMNGYAILNADTDLTNNGSLITLGDADDRYVNVTGDNMSGTLNMGANPVRNLPAPSVVSDATRKDYVDAGDAAERAFSTAGLATKVNRAGDTMSGALSMGGNRLTNLPAPADDADAARFQDVQAAVAGASANLIFFEPYDYIASSNVQGAIEAVADEGQALDTALRADLSDPSQGGGLVQVSTSTGDQTLVAALERRGPVFDTVSALDASTALSVGLKVHTLGYNSVGDGGGNDYEIVAAGTGTADGGSYIDLSGSSLQAKALFPTGIIYGAQFGISDDGTNQSDKVQAVIDYADSIQTNDIDFSNRTRIDFGDKNIYCSAPVSIEGKKLLEMYNGYFRALTSVLWTDSNALFVGDTSTRYVSFEKINFDGLHHANFLLSAGSNQVHVRRCQIARYRNLAIDLQANSSQAWIYNSNIYKWRGADAESTDRAERAYTAIRTDGVDVKIFDNLISWNGIGIELGSSYSLVCRNHVWEGPGPDADWTAEAPTINIRVTGNNNVISDNYIDNGFIDLYSGPNTIIGNTMLLAEPKISNKGFLRFVAESASQGTPVVTALGNVIPVTTSTDIDFVVYLEEGGNSFASKTDLPVSGEGSGVKNSFNISTERQVIASVGGQTSAAQIRTGGVRGLLDFIDSGTTSFTNPVQIGSSGDNAIMRTGGVERFNLGTNIAEFNVAATVGPATTEDGNINLGGSSRRWNTIYATNGTINTSDGREKQQKRDLSEAEKLVAIELKSHLCAFKWNDSVEEKGDGARWHFGVVAQEVASAFESHGLDAGEYGMFCYDEYDQEGNYVDRYGVRYEELLSFIIGAL